LEIEREEDDEQNADENTDFDFANR